MWFTPEATASRKMAIAPSMSAGGPHTSGPVSFMAPYPMRFTVNDVFGKVKVPPRLFLVGIRFLLLTLRYLVAAMMSACLDEESFRLGVRICLTLLKCC